MNIALWICQWLLMALFMYSGVMKSTKKPADLVAMGQTGVDNLPPPLVRFIGISEVLGAAGIILPWLTRKLPILTPIAAIGFAIIMVLAAPIHYRRREPRNVVTNLVILAISVFVAWGRTMELW